MADTSGKDSCKESKTCLDLSKKLMSKCHYFAAEQTAPTFPSHSQFPKGRGRL
jgi:hypothetical protein